MAKFQLHSIQKIFLQQNPKIQIHYFNQFQILRFLSNLLNTHINVILLLMEYQWYAILNIIISAKFYNFLHLKLFQLLWKFLSLSKLMFTLHLNFILLVKNRLDQHLLKIVFFYLLISIHIMDDFLMLNKQIILINNFHQFQ